MRVDLDSVFFGFGGERICRMLKANIKILLKCLMWLFIQFKNFSPPTDLDEKVRIKELQHFSSTMNFKNGIAVQSND